MPDVIELLDSTDEEEDTGSDEYKMRNLNTILGGRVPQADLARLLKSADGEVQGAVDAYFADRPQAGGGNSIPRHPAPTPARSPAGSLAVGDAVVLSVAATPENRNRGPLKPGVTGSVVQVEAGDDEPYLVKCPGGVTWWYREVEIEKAAATKMETGKPGGKRESPAGLLRDSGDDADCVVESAESRASKRQAVVTAEHYADDDEDVVITGADDPSMSWAHSRFDCRMPGNLFSAGSKTQNLKCCPNCYCFVCDVKAAKCTMWPTHCMADGSAQ